MVCLGCHGLLTNLHAATDEFGIPQEGAAIGDETVAAKIKVNLPVNMVVIVGPI